MPPPRTTRSTVWFSLIGALSRVGLAVRLGRATARWRARSGILSPEEYRCARPPGHSRRVRARGGGVVVGLLDRLTGKGRPGTPRAAESSDLDHLATWAGSR